MEEKNVETVVNQEYSKGLEIDNDGTLKGRGRCNDSVIVIPNRVCAIYVGAFRKDAIIKRLIVPSSVEIIGEEAFAYCANLTSVIINKGTTEIGESAFKLCSSLKSVEIIENEITIRDFAFNGCNQLKELSIPENIAHIGNYAFPLEDNLKYTVKDGLYYLGNKKNKYLILCKIADKNTTSISIDNNCKFILNNVCDGATSLESITIGENIKEIGEEAFNYCTSLKTIFFNAINCNRIRENAFFNIGQDGDGVNIIFGNNVKEIPYAMFCRQNAKITHITIGNSVENIKGYAFSKCSLLTEIEIPDSVINVGSDPFPKDNKTMYNVKDGIRYLGNKNNKYLILVDTVNKELTSAIIDENCKVIAGDSFSMCKLLKDMVIPNGVKHIGPRAFMSCSALENIILPNSISTIEEHTFWRCESLKNIIIPKSVDVIKEYAFRECTSLKTIVILNQEANISKEAFYRCDGVEIKASIEKEQTPQNKKTRNENNLLKQLKAFFQNIFKN